MMLSEKELERRAWEQVHRMPFYQDLSSQRKENFRNEVKDIIAKEDFCKEYNIKKVFNEEGSSIEYCGEHITFAAKFGAENFIDDMYEIAMCCSGKW